MDMALHPAVIRGMSGISKKPVVPEGPPIVKMQVSPIRSVAIVGDCTSLQASFMNALKGIGDKRSRFFVISTLKLIHTIVLADVILVCFDSADADSLNDAKEWAAKSSKQTEKATLILVGLSRGESEVKRQVVAEANGLYKLFGAKYYMQCNILSRLEVVDVFMTTSVEALAVIAKNRVTHPVPEPHVKHSANFNIIGKLHHVHHNKSNAKKLSFASSTKPGATRNSLKHTDNYVIDAQAMIGIGGVGSISPGNSPKTRMSSKSKDKDKEKEKEKAKKKAQKEAQKDKLGKKKDHKRTVSVECSMKPSYITQSDMTSSPSAIFTRDSSAGVGGYLPGNLVARTRGSVPSAAVVVGDMHANGNGLQHSPKSGLSRPQNQANGDSGGGTGRQLDRRAISDTTVFFPQHSEESHHSATSAERALGPQPHPTGTGAGAHTAHPIKPHHTSCDPQIGFRRSQSHAHTPTQSRTSSLVPAGDGLNSFDPTMHLGTTAPAMGGVSRSMSAAGLAQLATFVGPGVGQMGLAGQAVYAGGGSNAASCGSIAGQNQQSAYSELQTAGFSGLTPMSMIMDEDGEGLVMITPASVDGYACVRAPTRDSTTSNSSSQGGVVFEGIDDHTVTSPDETRRRIMTTGDNTGSDTSVKTNSSTVGPTVARCRNSQGGASIASSGIGPVKHQGGMRPCLSHLTIKDHEAAKLAPNSGMHRSSFTDTRLPTARGAPRGSNRRSMGDVSITSNGTAISQATGMSGLSQRRHSPYYNVEGVEIGVNNTTDGTISGEEGEDGKRDKDGKGGRFNKLFRRGSDYEDLVKVRVKSPVASPVIVMKRHATLTRLSEIKGLSTKYDVVGNPRRTKSLHTHSQTATGRASSRKSN
ncbi:hypothetical protein SARC_09738 [Sphaeroforma arctica JP610]|uniref:Uncharacterized protein n=1 Tax=Sphaeroforma arctica JP610 TaxID=667725 RepID=A0A0L0FM01_9EUKA|nr:hypothetical protein SARC_09738 [Sphaeroforma arctica JP610]KNC77809.1 hypothetical protein SARC_09738 [Sphaeroforma arctica JP610]|eukprot:XP_014151711.1 hypothetical protein SARC_09738 [Sphaeroforma arctica JP610]